MNTTDLVNEGELSINEYTMKKGSDELIHKLQEEIDEIQWYTSG